MSKSPCWLCERRTVGCHNKCADYAEYRKKVEAAREKEKADTAVFDYFAEKKRTMQKLYKKGR